MLFMLPFSQTNARIKAYSLTIENILQKATDVSNYLPI